MIYNRELDELEREDFTRLKKVQANKAVAAKAEKLAKDQQKAREEEAEAAMPPAELKKKEEVKAEKKKKEKAVEPEALSGFDAADDEDVVFK